GDAARRKGGAESIDISLQLRARRVCGEPVRHQVEGGVLAGNSGYGGAEQPRVLAAEVRASLVDVDDSPHDCEHRLRRDAYDLEPLANRDVVELRERSRERDLVGGARPSARGDTQLLHGPACVVPTERVHGELAAAGLELQRGGRVRPAGCRRAEKLRGSGNRPRIGAAVEGNLQMRALLRLEGGLVRIVGLGQEGERHGPGAQGEQGRGEDHRRLEAPPLEVGDRFDHDGGHPDYSSPRTRTTSAAGRSVVSSRASSTILPSITLTTREACRVASLASWVTRRIVCPSR